MSKKTQDIDLTQYLRKKGSPLADHVPSLMRAANKYRVDPRLLIAISGGETSFGTNGRGPSVHNAWGIGPGRAYDSWDEGIDSAAKLLRQGYIGEGLTSLQAIQQKWAPVGAGNDPSNLNSNWIRTIGSFYSSLGGNPNDVTKDWRNASAPSKFVAPPPTATPTSPKSPAIPRIPSSPGFGNIAAEQAFKNLASIAEGGDPTKSLASLVDATFQQTMAEAAAQVLPEVVPEKEQKVSPDGGSYKWTKTSEQAADPRRQKAVDIALKQIGKPYVWGTAGPKSFDCSGLIEWAYEQAGIKTPGRVWTGSMMRLGHSVKGSSMQPGDWVITNKGKHVVMYIGGGEVVAAPRSGTNVQIQKLADHKAGIVDVRRYP